MAEIFFNIIHLLGDTFGTQKWDKCE